ncbi:hypothetical protein AYO38_11345, partial [bacterium SCGC AG-212-C10]
MERKRLEQRLKLPLAAVFFLAVAALVMIATPGQSQSASGVLYTFDGAPASPVRFNPADWDIAVTSRDQETWDTLPAMQAAHGPGCDAPPATHTVTEYEQTVFQCKDHIMTSLFATGYGVTYLTPSSMVDFSTGTATIKWDMSTLSVTQRDFIDLWITPFDLNQVHPLDDFLPDLQGEPKEAIQIRMDQSPTGPIFRGKVVRNFQATEVESNWWTGYNTVLTQDAKRRDTFQLEISRTHIKFGMPQYNLWWIDTDIANLGWSGGVVQFGHHSYNPFKDGNGGPNTWHWDNVSINPATPFSMNKADRRMVNTNGASVNLAQATASGGKLRFSGIGKIDVSFDGGTTWTAAVKQQQELQKADHFSSYWTSIPAGVSKVTFRGGPDDWFKSWEVKDISVWSKGGSSSVPAPLPTATSVPPTAVPPTATPVVPTATVPAPTAIPAQPTAVPTKTAVPGTGAPAANTRIKWQGKDWYLQGVNMPWYNWQCDFGCAESNGVSNAGNKSSIAARFAKLQTAGEKNVRWWLFPGDPWQITRDANGAPSGINPAVYADIDAALALAQQYDLTYTFTLFSGPTALPSSWLTNPTQRTQLATVLGELFAHYNGNARIMTWQVINEPEWDIWSGKASQSDVQSLVKQVAAQVHANSKQYVSVGAAMVDGLPLWKGLGLDYYTAHWYDYMSGGDWCAFCSDYAAIKAKYNLDAPLLIGEFYAGSDVNPLQRFSDMYSKGFAGAFAWSLFPEKTADNLPVDLNAAAAFAAQKTDIGPKGTTSGGGTGGGTIPSLPTATPTKTATPAPTATATVVAPTKTPTATATAVAPTK